MPSDEQHASGSTPASGSQRRPSFISVDSRVVPDEDARVHVLSTALKFAAGVFEGTRAYWSESDGDLYVFRLDAHLRRLADSVAIYGFDFSVDVEAIQADVRNLLRANELRENCHVRVQVFVVSDDGTIADTGPCMLCVATMPMEAFFAKPILDLCVSSWQRIGDRSLPARAKSIANYQNSRLALLEARRNGYDGPILLGEQGGVAEGSGYNVFLVRGGRVITPTITDSILEGVTRESVLRLAEQHLGLPVEERHVDRTELYVADEVFVTGSAAEVTPVATVDRVQVGDGSCGPITAELRRAYAAAARREQVEAWDWTLPVYGGHAAPE